MLEFFLELLGELIVQGAMELSFRSLADVFRTKRTPILSVIGCILWVRLQAASASWSCRGLSSRAAA